MFSIYKDNRFTGVQYSEDSERIRAHHAQYGQNGVWVTQSIVERVDEDGETIYRELTQDELDEAVAQDAKIVKVATLSALFVTVNSVEYDAHQEAINNMASVAGVAHSKYNQAVAGGLSPAEAYDAIYKSSITWKGKDNLPHSVQVESIVEALEKAMQERAEVYGV